MWDTAAASRRPTISPDHPRLDGTAAARVRAYLRAGTVVLRSSATQPDLFMPDPQRKVQTSTYTDGRWYWNDSLIYYVGTYALSPGQEFLDYMDARHDEPRVPNDQEIGQARSILGLR